MHLNIRLKSGICKIKNVRFRTFLRTISNRLEGAFFLIIEPISIFKFHQGEFCFRPG